MQPDQYYSAFAERTDVHPYYAKMSWWWRFFELHYIGGPDYYSPDIPITYLYPSLVRGGGETSDASSDREWLSYDAIQLRSFLWPDNRERLSDYEQRVARAVRINLCAPVVDLYTAQVLGRQITREARGSAVLDMVWEDIDLRGSSVDEWMAEGISGAQVFGHMFAVVDMSGAGADKIESLADQISLGIRPYATWFTPLQVPDWEVDDVGGFRWIKICEPDPGSRRARPGESTSHAERYRIWFPDHYEIVGKPSKAAGESLGVCEFCGFEGVIASGPNPLGRVPVEVLYRQRKPGVVDPIGMSGIAEIAMADREVFNLLSRRQTLVFHQGVPLLAVPDPGQMLKEIRLSVHWALPYNPAAGGGPPTYVAPSPDSVRVIDEQIAAWILQVRASSGLARGQSELSVAARSGDALLVETNDKAAMLKAIANQAEDFELRLITMMLDYVGESADGPTIKYPERYDVSDMGDDLDAIKKFLDMAPIDAVRAEVMKMVQARLLKHLPTDTLAKLQSETMDHAPTTHAAGVKTEEDGEEKPESA